jgi:membrane protease YdiL (CAAX protease family)
MTVEEGIRKGGGSAAEVPWGPWQSLVMSSGILMVYFAVQVGIALPIESTLLSRGIGEILSEGKPFSGFSLSVSIIAGATVCTVLTVLCVRLRKGLAVGDYLALNAPRAGDLARWILLAAALMLCFEFLSILMQRQTVPSFMVEAYRTARFAPLIYAAVVLAGPVFEEILFRGFLFKGLERSRLGARGAIIFTALLWSVIHVQYDFLDMFNVFALGIVLGAARASTGSTCLTIAMHVLNNLVSMIQVASQSATTG